MRKFDYSFLKNGLLPTKLLNLTSSITELKTFENIQKKDFGDMFVKLESLAKVQSVKNSNAIEGIITTDKRIDEIVNGQSAPIGHDEMEIAGYRDCLDLIHKDYELLPVNESFIKKLHSLLLSYTGSTTRGAYKKSDNSIIETDIQGNRKVRFQPTSAFETPMEMEQLLLAYMDARQDASINKLLLTPCFILDFLCVHPFDDGNGRMSRLLTLLTLYQNNYDAGKYISYEEQINNNKVWYYQALKDSSNNWHEGNNDYTPFMENFLTMLYLCYKELDKRFGVVGSKKQTKKARIELVILESIKPLSKQEILLLIPDTTATTIEATLSGLLRDGKIQKVGSGKATRYLKA